MAIRIVRLGSRREAGKGENENRRRRSVLRELLAERGASLVL
jgi:hypothetical protein